MTRPILLLGVSLLSALSLVRGQALDNAEVRLPYSELKKLLGRALTPPKPKVPAPALLSTRLLLSLENGNPVILATLRSTGFSDEFAFLPLLSGDISLESQTPEDAVIVFDKDFLSLAVDSPGPRTTRLKLIPVTDDRGFSLKLPSSPSVIFETGDLPDGQSIRLTFGGHDELIASAQTRALPPTARSLRIEVLDREQSHEASRPPEPSTWSWQQQALIQPSESDLIYHIIARATATDGSGVEATLLLPPNARDLTFHGEDLLSHHRTRGNNRSLSASLVWGTRGILDREIMISYRLPLRPLDLTWKLQAPGGAEHPTRFIITSSPFLTYAAPGLSDALAQQVIPSALGKLLKGGTYQLLEAINTAELTVTRVPIAPTAEGMISKAEWNLKIEPDGAMLATGDLTIDHKHPLDFIFDTPAGMNLLSCEVNGTAASPVDLGEGVLKLSLTASGENTRIDCGFTGNAGTLDPVEGTLALSLPKTPMFIHSLLWRLELPAGYQAETSGNLKRVRITGNEAPARLAFKKNLCRDERPEVRIFYQRSNLNR